MLRKWTQRVLVFAIRGYRLFLSPFFGQHCRFHPTCSVYAIEAIEVHGPWYGSWLALRRVGRLSLPGGEPRRLESEIAETRLTPRWRTVTSSRRRRSSRSGRGR